MLRISAIVGLGLAALGGANAASIFTPIDLTQAPVGLATCSGASCSLPAASFTTGTYLNQLFTATSNGVPSPSPTAQNVTTGAGMVPFITNSQSGGKDTYYTASSTNLSSEVVVDLGTCTGVVANLSTCGAFNIADVFTMIQANVEGYGYQGITITLNGTSGNGLTAVTDTINLTAGVDYRGSSNISTTNPGGVICTDANGGSGCANDQALVSGLDATPGGTAGNSVSTSNNVYGAITNVSNHYYLDVQELELPINGANSFINGYLNSVTITNLSGGAGERMLFSGLTLEAAPEPGTIALLGIGLGLLAFMKIRRSRSAA